MKQPKPSIGSFLSLDLWTDQILDATSLAELPFFRQEATVKETTQTTANE